MMPDFLGSFHAMPARLHGLSGVQCLSRTACSCSYSDVLLAALQDRGNRRERWKKSWRELLFPALTHLATIYHPLPRFKFDPLPSEYSEDAASQEGDAAEMDLAREDLPDAKKDVRPGLHKETLCGSDQLPVRMLIIMPDPGRT